MATYDLKYPGAAIDAILDTAYHLQQAGYIFRGSASDYSGTPTEREWVIAPAGFSGLGLSSAVPKGSIGICLYNGTSWTGKIINVLTLDSAPTRNSQNGVTSGGVAATLDEIAGGIMETFASLLFDDETASADLSTKLSYAVKFSVSDVYQTVTHLNILAATTSKAGLMSAEDKAKVDSFLTNLRSLTFADTTASADQATKITETLKATIGGVQEVIDSITILAATSSKAGLLSASDKAYIDALPAALTSLSNSISAALALMESLVGYYVCDTSAATAAKTVTATGYSLTNGGCIRIKMTNANTAANVTLNINSTGEKALYYDGAQASSTNTWEAGEVLEVYYDGTQYQCASGGGGKFATGEKVKEVGITDVLDNSHNLIESAPINAILNDTLLLSDWIQGTLNNHEYSYIDTRIISCAVVSGAVSYNIAQGYAMSIHEYSGVYTDVHQLSDSTWIKMTTSWIEGSGVFTPDAQTKTLAILLSKTPTSSGAVILPSDASHLTIGYANPMTLDNMRVMLNEHEREIDFLNEAVTIQEENELAFVEGTLSNTHKYGIPSSSEAAYKKRIIATMPTPQHLTVTMSSGYYCSIHEYSEYFQNPVSINDGSSWLGNTHPWFTGTLQIEPLASSKTIVFILGKGSSQDQTITPIEGVNASVVSLSSVKRDIEINSEGIDAINGVLYGTSGELITETVALEQGGMEADGKKSGPISTKRIRTVDFVKTDGEFALSFTNGVLYNIFYYSAASESSFVKQLNAWHSETPFIDTWRGYIRLGIKNQSETNITPSATTLTITYMAVNNGLIPRVDALDYAGSDSYVWGVDMIKKKCRTIQLGSLTYLQAFCKYNGNYYSINGSNIAEQDDTFTVLRDVACSVGHGNSLQLVSNGKAWASGWDDQKMYRVDLATLTVDQTITLPTTGYTTCAVDEDNGWVYIFQRDTNPNYIGQYTFIVYDYVNEQILRTRKIESFAAMQSVDYYQGKILMVFGLGTQTAPSGMRIYNTAGDVLATFDLEIFSTDEPEGIMFTRDTGELLVSDVDKNLYIVS